MGLRDHLGSVIAAVAALLPFTPAAHAQAWPTRFITLVVPFGAGSATDLVARVIAAQASEELGQQIVVENAGGAGGVIGVERVAKAAPDGYQMVLGAVDTFAQSQWLFKNPKYNSVRDFTPVALAAEQPLVLTVRKELPVSNLQDFVAYVKANQAKMQFGSAGVGAAPYLACYGLTAAIGAKVTHIPYRGSAPAMQDMMAGSLDYYCPVASGAMPLIESKSIKALAVFTPERSPLLPNLPTAREQGVDLADGSYWMGFFLPRGVPPAIVAKLNAAITKALDTPALQARMRDLASTIVPAERRSAEYLAKFLADEVEKWGPIMKASGVVPE